jgi:hypothetical protein
MQKSYDQMAKKAMSECNRFEGAGYYCFVNPLLFNMEKGCENQGVLVTQETLEGRIWKWVCNADKTERAQDRNNQEML